jgi:ribonuclease VapC
MVIDSSALIAVLLGEPEAESFARLIANDPKRFISAFTALETSIVIEAKKGEAGSGEFDLLLNLTQIKIVPMDAKQFRIARLAWKNYGKGRHPAGLNIGDCCSYALAKHLGEPLLFKGDDFTKTDIPDVRYLESD